ncbi:methyltransferase, FkbM family [Monaibacterium marinum]|uniref:Methyltransferase, FkbM family n=1 Tax=Pontivivens marinum TaxID=1690039 RepID=A0A2C9CPW3_9RHOB|nr:FkbM family methyltransferase [Monaibacterium marinum]SOH93245.1 methyltransferase, FkbM family [Monaibacterium marinum]
MSFTPPNPPFGTYAISPTLERLRLRAERAPRRWIASGIRRLIQRAQAEPYDVVVFGNQKARLHPADNRAEKRVLSGTQYWDLPERTRLAQAIAEAGDTFCFVDAGANVGMYTLSVRADAQRAGKAVQIVAIEPDPVNAGRLRCNLAASDAVDVHHAAVALSDSEGEVSFVSGGLENRGEARIGEGDLTLPCRPLLSVVQDAGLPRIDAMKMDIEGYEIPVLTAFFASALPQMLPRLVIMETGRDAGGPLPELMIRHGYHIEMQTGINTIFVLGDAAQPSE